MKHMIDEHTFYVPDIEYVSDLKGLMNYLGEKISIGNTCIYCHKMFHSLEAIRKHMVSFFFNIYFYLKIIYIFIYTS